MGDFSTSALANRAMSAFPVSIGTSLALESIFQPMQAPYDPDRPIPQRFEISEYKVFWVNLLTLYRNIQGALSKDGANAVMAQDLSDTLNFEVDLIRRLVNEESLGKCEVVFYASDYAGLAHAHPHALLRQATTDKQRLYNTIMEATLKDFFQQHVKSDMIQHFSRLIMPASRRKGLILTHYAYDLLAEPYFEELDLIESHTGTRKGKALWYTKFNNSKDLMRMPFCAMTLQVFGDSQTFVPQPVKTRQSLIELADRYQWNPLVSRERMRFSLDNLGEPYTAQMLKEMLSE